MIARRVLLLGLVLLVLSPARAGDVPESCRAFRSYDRNGDGTVEIEILAPIAGAGKKGRIALLLIEARLLAPLDGAPALNARLERWAADLAAEGYRAHVVAATLGQSVGHRDGEYVLALREFLRVVNGDGALAGVVLVGRFPDAFLVRVCNWRRREDVTFRKGQNTQKTITGGHCLRRVPEDVAHRADIVLADLDGRWEDVYVQPRTRLETVHAVFPGKVPASGGPCLDLERGHVAFADFFHVSDGKLEVRESLDAAGKIVGWSLGLHDRSGDHECGASDRARPNAMARPDILVSRLDARGVALRPRTDVRGVDGGGLLDDDGKPRAVRFASAKAVPHWRDGLWEADPVLERRLLAEYLDRNHAYRTGTAPIAWRPAALACGLGSGYGVMARAAAGWKDPDRAATDVHGSPNLLAVVDWFRAPAILRTIRAHSDPHGCAFKRREATSLDARLGGPAWSWTRRGDRLVPSLATASGGGRLDWFLLRSLWENGVVAAEPAFYHHTGCHAISPACAKHRPYDDPRYGWMQGAESLLFFARGLALVGRSKVFYDEPRGFVEALRAGDTFGAAWARYFEIESSAGSWGKVGGDIGRKRAYFWSVLGDWSLTLASRDPGRRGGERR